MGIAELNHAGTFGVFDHAAFQRHGAQLIGRTAAWPHGEILSKSSENSFAVLVGGGVRSGKGFWPVPGANACLSSARRSDKLGVQGVNSGPPRPDWPGRAACRARPAQ